MSKTHFQTGLFIFRRDLRVSDNIGLNMCNAQCDHIIPVFIFTPEQVGNKNVYKSNNAVQFMMNSLQDLSMQIQMMHPGGSATTLHTYYGDNVTVLKHIIEDYNVNCVYFNVDYTPYARERDSQIAKLCNKMGIDVRIAHDYYLNAPGTILNGSGDPYQKFTPYYETAKKEHVMAPTSKRRIHFINKRVNSHKNNSSSYEIRLGDARARFSEENLQILVHGGRKAGLKQLAHALKTQIKYNNTHNMLSVNTSLLSAYIKFGCISIREVYKAFQSKLSGIHRDGILRQLHWRDFYANILYAYPHVLGHALKPAYNRIKWHQNARLFQAWTEGETGFPIVDAGMRQMNATGYMHNRARLIVATFLIKTLLIDWRKGEQYFARMLTDYDPASNNGNWQWCAGSGADSQPYFRIFNPWEQSAHNDPDAAYIKEWVPELREVSPKAIHTWYKECEDPVYKQVEYGRPIVDYKEQKEKVLAMYKKIFS